MDKLRAPDTAAELLKRLRGQWLTPYAAAKQLGMHPHRTLGWMRRLHANGLLAERKKQPHYGPLHLDVREYTVAPAWMGVES